MKHNKQIIVNCWKCGKPFDVVTAERCYEHLNIGYNKDLGQAYTTKCSHCGACVCHKFNKMKPVDCEVLNKVGITHVMPSVHKQLTKEASRQ